MRSASRKVQEVQIRQLPTQLQAGLVHAWMGQACGLHMRAAGRALGWVDVSPQCTADRPRAAGPHTALSKVLHTVLAHCSACLPEHGTALQDQPSCTGLPTSWNPA